MTKEQIPFSDYDSFHVWIKELKVNNELDKLEVILNKIPFSDYDSFDNWILGLKLDLEITELSNMLKFSNKALNLSEKREYFLSLNISIDKLKMVLLRVYNDYYNKNTSNSQDFQDFFDYRYISLLESKISVIKNSIKKANRNPKKRQKALAQYYSGNKLNFRISIIKKILASRNYNVISDFDIKDTLVAYSEWKDLDIVDDLIERYNNMDLIDSDVIEYDEIGLREQEQYKSMYEQYSEKEKDQDEIHPGYKI